MEQLVRMELSIVVDPIRYLMKPVQHWEDLGMELIQYKATDEHEQQPWM